MTEGKAMEWVKGAIKRKREVGEEGKNEEKKKESWRKEGRSGKKGGRRKEKR